MCTSTASTLSTRTHWKQAARSPLGVSICTFVLVKQVNLVKRALTHAKQAVRASVLCRAPTHARLRQSTLQPSQLAYGSRNTSNVCVPARPVLRAWRPSEYCVCDRTMRRAKSLNHSYIYVYIYRLTGRTHICAYFMWIAQYRLTGRCLPRRCTTIQSACLER